jgi:hypothetical protein
MARRTGDVDPWEDADGTVEVPAYYRREIADRHRIATECPIDVYTSSQNPRWGWPYKLNRAGKQSPATARSCGSMLVDAGYHNLTDSAEIAMTAHRTDADIVIARDLTSNHPVVGDDRDRVEKSIGLAFYTAFWLDVLRGTEGETVGQWPVSHDADVMLPLQPPYEVGLEWLSEPRPVSVTAANHPRYISAYDRFDHFAVGGLQDIEGVDERVRALETVREYVGDEVHVHALAPGTEIEMLQTLRERPGLVDSIDISTPECAPANNKLPDKTWQQHRHPIPTGMDVTTVRAQYSAAIAVQLAFMLTPSLCDDDVFEETTTEQEQINAFA